MSPQKKSLKFFLSLAAIFPMIPLISAVEDSGNDTAEKLPPVVVTTSPLVQEIKINDTADVITIVARPQIEDLNAMDIGSTLRTVPGVVISRRNIAGSYGGSTGGGIFIRGLGVSRPGGELVTLYDGVPRVNPTFSHPLLDLLSTDAAGAIHVHKAVAPSQFGNAFAAINILPRFMPKDREQALAGAIAAGTDSTIVEQIAGGIREGKFDIYAGQSFRRSAGHRINSGGELGDYFINAGYDFSENWRLTFSGDITNNYSEDPGNTANNGLHQGNYHTRDAIGVISLLNDFEDANGFAKIYFHNGTAIWRDQGMRDTGGTITGASTDMTLMNWDSFGLRAREEFVIFENGKITIGTDIDAVSGKVSATHYGLAPDVNFPREDLQLYSPHIAISHTFAADTIFVRPAAGIRLYEHSVFGAEFAPNAGVTFGVNDTEIRAVYARGVNYPGLNVAVLSTMMPTLGTSWRELSAEKLDHFEVGVAHNFSAQFKMDIAGFYDHGKDRYVMIFPFPPSGFVNLGEYHNKGVEVSFSYSPAENLSFFAGATWLKSNVGNLPYAPEWTASAGATWCFLEDFRLTIDLVYQDTTNVFPDSYARQNIVGNAIPVRVPSVLLVNAKLAWEFSAKKMNIRKGEIFLALENLTDRDYYYQPGYPMPGIGAMLGIKMEL